MTLKTEHDNKTQVLERLLADARSEADELRARLVRYEQILVSTRLIMGHELRKPATAINGYLDLVIEDLETRDQQDTLAFAQKAADECMLLNDLNDYFVELLRTGKDAEEVGREAVDVERLFIETAAHVRESLHAEREIEVTVDLAELCVHVDEGALKLVVMNLLENAVKYSQVDSPIRLEAERACERRGATEEPLLKIRVIDEGVGIPTRHLHRVFEPFVRLRSDVAEGSGLGLTLVRSLVELHGGEVSINSSTGKGTTVYVTLPVLPTHSNEPVIQL